MNKRKDEARPALVEVGQSVVIQTGGHTYRGTVIKAGRVWVEIRPRDWTSGSRRFRLDTQTDGSGIGYGARFYTLDQWAAHERQVEAGAYLRGQGISLDSGSPWRGREVELAALLAGALRDRGDGASEA